MCGKLETLSSCPILIFEFRGKPSLVTVICMDPHPPNNQFILATKYCFLILGNDTSFFFFFSIFFVFMLCYFVIICYCFIIINIFFQKNQFNLFMFRNVLCSSFFFFFSGGGGCGVDTFSLKLPSIPYQKIKIPIFEDFLINKNLTKICFKMVFYKDHHRMITPDSNNFQRQYNIDPMPHNLF